MHSEIKHRFFPHHRIRILKVQNLQNRIGFVSKINVSMILITLRNGSSVKSSANDVVAANLAIFSFTAAEFEERATFVPIDRKCVSIRGVGLSVFRFFQLSIIGTSN